MQTAMFFRKIGMVFMMGQDEEENGREEKVVGNEEENSRDFRPENSSGKSRHEGCDVC
jgi:hypothetical protein